MHNRLKKKILNKKPIKVWSLYNNNSVWYLIIGIINSALGMASVSNKLVSVFNFWNRTISRVRVHWEGSCQICLPVDTFMSATPC